MPTTIVSGRVIAIEPMTRYSNLYERTFTNLVMVRQGNLPYGAENVNVLELVAERDTTIRLRLVKIDEAGVAVPYDLTDITPNLVMTRLRLYGESSVTPDLDEEMTVETPATLGMCYLTLAADDVPGAGEYKAEVQLVVGSGESQTVGSFGRFSVRVVTL